MYFIRDQLRCGSAGNECSCDNNIHITTLFHEQLHLGLDELLGHLFCVSTCSGTFLLDINLKELGSE